jgi:hypothetical protein
MKDNQIPRYKRLENKIRKLESIEYGLWVKIRKGNPYLRCKYCDVTNVQNTLTSHHKYCKYKGIEKEIRYYKNILSNFKCSVCGGKIEDRYYVKDENTLYHNKCKGELCIHNV